MYNCLQRSPAGNPFAQYQSTVTMNTSPSPSRTSVSTTTSTISSSLNVAELWERVNEVIDTNISYIEKTGYLEAKVKSPHLIEIETNVERFLSFEKWNIYATAQRIVKYWEWKRTLYGEYRTFLPILDISGTYGAMDSDDVQYIKSGIVTLLPDDDHGNLVAYFCPYRLSGDDHWGGLTQVKRSRITFYFLCVFVETYYSKHPYSNQQRNQPNQLSDESDETTSTPSTATTSTDTASFVLLAVIQSFVSRPNTNFRDVVTEAMPIQLLRTDMIFHPPLSTTSSLMNTVDNSLFSYLAKSILRAFIPTSPTLIQFLNVHTMYCFNPHDIAMQLEQKLQYGLRAANLPIEIGGNWSYDIFNKWFEATHQHYVSLNENKVQLLLLLQSQQSRSGNIGVGGEADDNNSNTLQSIQQNNTYFIDDGPAMITQLMATTSCSNSTTATPDDSSAGLVAPNNYNNHYIVDTTTATGTVDNSYNYSVTGAGSSSGCYVSDDNTTAATALPPPTNNSIDYNNYIEDKVVGTITKTDAAVPASASTSPMDDAYLLSAQQMYAQQQEQQNLLFGQVLNGFHGMIGTNQSHVVDNTNTITNENYGIVPSLLPESTNITPYKLCGRQQQASSSYPCVSSDSPSSSYYWSLREKLFGSNRSKLPMNQTGSGALFPDDIELLNSGFIMILPKNIASECVVSYDPSKASSGGSGTISFEHHRRCFFYYFDLLSRMYSTQGLTEPISLVLLSFIHQDVATDGILDETFADIIMAFPNVKIVCIHLLMEPIQLGWYSYQASAKSKVLSLFGIKDADDSIIEYHTLPQLEASSTTSATTKGYCIDEQDLVGSFSATYGYQRKYLPERMGGGWNSRKFKKWQQEVMSLQLSEEHGKSFLPK